MSSGTIISEATQVCLQSFTNCLEVEELLKDEWAENRLADFNLWISGTGALAGGRASLDHRLRAKPEARAVIANLLRLLAETVEKCKTSSQIRSLSWFMQLLTGLEAIRRFPKLSTMTMAGIRFYRPRAFRSEPSPLGRMSLCRMILCQMNSWKSSLNHHSQAPHCVRVCRVLRQFSTSLLGLPSRSDNQASAQDCKEQIIYSDQKITKT